MELLSPKKKLDAIRAQADKQKTFIFIKKHTSEEMIMFIL